jgi:ABC-type Mn2+/Zn2+ transport system ATPase subunit
VTPLPSDAIIFCRDLHVSYGREPVLRGVSLSVDKGVFLPLVGPNGAGKTTLLRAIIGLVRPDSGSVQTPFAQEPPGYVPQQGVIDPLYPVPVKRIVAMGLYPRLGWWRRANNREEFAVDQALEQVGLAGHADKTFSQLSGGMRQKTLIARALAARPQVLILDEPTAGLDEASQIEIMAHLRAINQEQGRTIIMAHHGDALLAGAAIEAIQVEHGQLLTRRLNHAG